MEASRQPGPDDASNERGGATFRARLRGIGKAFGATQAVLDADLDIRAGEVHALLGENGAGKTTLMRVLAGILRPDAGSMEIGNEPADLRGRMDGAQRGIGLVQQHFGLIEEINGVQNYSCLSVTLRLPRMYVLNMFCMRRSRLWGSRLHRACVV